MKNLKKIIVFVLAFTFLTSSMILTSSAAFFSTGTSCGGNSVTWSTSNGCSEWQSSDCTSSSCTNSILNGQYSYNCPTADSTAGCSQNTDPASGSCTWDSESIEAFLNAAAQTAEESSDEDNAAEAEIPVTAVPEPSEDTYTAPAEKTADTQSVKAAAQTAAETTENTVASNCNIGSVETIVGNYTVSDADTADYSSALRNYLNSFLTNCGLDFSFFGISLPDGSDTTDSPAAEAPAQEPSAPVESSTPETSAPVDTGSSDSDTNADIDNLSFEEQVVALVNEQRAAYGLEPLTLSAELSDAARAKSQDMHDNNYFSHTSPTYGSPFAMLTSFGISYSSAGENIAMGYATPEAVMEAWMNSSGHRANILNASYTQIGVGYVADGSYWTQEFIG